MSWRVLVRRMAASVTAAALLVSPACTAGDAGSGGRPDGDATASSTDGGAPAGPPPYLPVPEGVVLTDPGSELGLGETATVAWRLRDGDIGVLRLKVRKLVRADIGALKDWQLDLAGRRSALYYVTVTATNAGAGDLGGRRIPLLLLAGSGAFVESSTFKTTFAPCPSPSLPKSFEPGDKVTVCQVYLVPKRGALRAMAFRPDSKFNPVTWVGKVSKPKPPKKGKKQQ